MEMNFCRRCGTKLAEVSKGVFRCQQEHTLFPNPAPTTGIFFITDTNDVLVSVRGIEPRKGMLDSFGGFVDDKETAEQAAVRELKEELGLDPGQYDELKFLSTEIDFYPYQNEDRSILSIFYWSRLKPGVELLAADDVAAIERIALANIDFDKFDSSDVREALIKLQKILL